MFDIGAGKQLLAEPMDNHAQRARSANLMAVLYSENAAHKATLISLEAAKQQSIGAAAGNAAAIKNAELAYFRGARASALQNNCSPAQFSVALHELGVRT
jgi:hypothetical protein